MKPSNMLILIIASSGFLILTTRISEMVGASDPSLVSFSSLLIFLSYSIVAIFLLVGLGILKFGKITLSELGWNCSNLKNDIATGFAGFMIISLFLWGGLRF